MKRQWCFLIFIFMMIQLAKAGNIDQAGATIGDAFNLGVSAGKGVISKSGDLVPSFGDLYNFGKQNLLGLPFEAVIGILDKVCK